MHNWPVRGKSQAICQELFLMICVGELSIILTGEGMEDCTLSL